MNHESQTKVTASFEIDSMCFPHTSKVFIPIILSNIFVKDKRIEETPDIYLNLGQLQRDISFSVVGILLFFFGDCWGDKKILLSIY